MGAKWFSEKGLLEGLTPHTAHGDELVSIEEFDSAQTEFEEGELDRELVKRRQNSPEIDGL